MGPECYNKQNERCEHVLCNFLSNPAVKKVCGPQEGHCEKRCEIQGGGQEWL